MKGAPLKMDCETLKIKFQSTVQLNKYVIVIERHTQIRSGHTWRVLVLDVYLHDTSTCVHRDASLQRAFQRLHTLMHLHTSLAGR